MKYDINNAWDCLIEEFAGSLDNNNKEQYKNVFKEGDFRSIALQKFRYSVVLSIAENRIEELIKLIGIASKSICSFAKSKRSKKTYYRIFIAYMEGVLTSKSK